MKNVELKISLPAEWIGDNESIKALQARLLTLFVLDKVRTKEISAGKGAEMLGIHLTDFAQLMKEFGIPFFSEIPRNIKDLKNLFPEPGRG